MSYRMGIGYDLHRLRSGRPLYLGGVEIPFEKGLEGYSDADVLLHAICDALLGSVADGDLGSHFPPGDETFRACRSTHLLERVVERLWKKGFIVVNLDTVVVAQQPTIAPYRDEMVSSISNLLEVQPEHVSVKATTTEGLGAEGRGEAISAKAIVLVRSIDSKDKEQANLW